MNLFVTFIITSRGMSFINCLGGVLFCSTSKKVGAIYLFVLSLAVVLFKQTESHNMIYQTYGNGFFKTLPSSFPFAY